MAFTQALYYPWIDVQNSTWLKNAMLYWDKIHTIVPESLKTPYRNNDSEEFYDNGQLIPLRVNSNMRDVNILEDKVWEYFNTKETAALFLTNTSNGKINLYRDKLPPGLRNSLLYLEKLPSQVRYAFEHLMENKGSTVSTDAKFAHFYMTLLATSLAENRNFSLLTDTSAYKNLSQIVQLDNTINLIQPDIDFNRHRYHNDQKQLSEALLSNLLIERINLAPNTPAKKIIKFKKEYKDELGRFRTKVSELSATLKMKADIRVIRQQIEDLIINEIKPAQDDLKNALISNRIKCAKGFFTISFFSIPSTSLAQIILGTTLGPVALFAAAGVSVTTQAVMYNKEKKGILNKNPYSYLLMLEKKFTKNVL